MTLGPHPVPKRRRLPVRVDDGPAAPGALEVFRCIPLGCKLTRQACGARHGRLLAGIGDRGRESKAVRHTTCARCGVGKAHAAGEAPTEWPDELEDVAGRELELVEAPAVHRDIKPQNEEDDVSGLNDPAKQEHELEDDDLGEVLEGKPLRFRLGDRTLSIFKAAREHDCMVSEGTLRNRIAMGWPPRDALHTSASAPRPNREDGEPNDDEDEDQGVTVAPELQWRAWAILAAPDCEHLDVSGWTRVELMESIEGGLQSGREAEKELEDWRSWACDLESIVLEMERDPVTDEPMSDELLRGHVEETKARMQLRIDVLVKEARLAGLEVLELEAKLAEREAFQPDPVRVVRPPRVPAPLPAPIARLPLAGGVCIEIRASVGVVESRHWARLGRLVRLFENDDLAEAVRRPE